MTSKTITKKRRARKSYEDRTGLSTRAAKILIAAIHTKPATVEDDAGNVIRVWKSSEMSSYSNADIASCLKNRVAVEPNEMLGTVPPSAIKYAVTKEGWLLPNESKDPLPRHPQGVATRIVRNRTLSPDAAVVVGGGAWRALDTRISSGWAMILCYFGYMLS
jgi:hypothetical protein